MSSLFVDRKQNATEHRFQEGRQETTRYCFSHSEDLHDRKEPKEIIFPTRFYMDGNNRGLKHKSENCLSTNCFSMPSCN